MKSCLLTIRRTGLLVGGCLLALSVAQEAGAQARAPCDVADEILLLEPSINGAAPDAAIFVVKRGEDVLLPAAFLKRHGIRFGGAVESVSGEDYVHAGDIATLRARVDEASGKLDIVCSASCFDGQSMAARGASAHAISPIEPGAFLNYDVYTEAGDAGRSTGAFAEMGLFTNFGTGVSGLYCSRREADTKCGRLDTSWTIDDPASAHRLVIGDSTTRAGRWGAPARFAGLSWGTDFSLQPEFVSFPTPVVQGESTLASSVEVYINDALRFQTETPAGPFRITDIPVVTGEGTARTVIRDVLGREQTIVTAFYSSPQLLKAGLETYAVEGGLLRQGYGGERDRYADPFLAAGYSRGLSDFVTLGVRSEVGAKQQSFGVSALLADARFGESEGALAFSGGDNGSGGLVKVAQQYRSSALTVGGVVTAATPDFRIFGSDRASPRLASNAFVGLSSERYGSTSLSWTYRDERHDEDFSAIGLNYASRFMGASVFVTALRTNAKKGAYVGSLTISIPLGGRGASASAGTDYDGRKFGADLRIRSDAPQSGGVGYHARVSKDGVDRYEAGIVSRMAFGDVAADYSRADGEYAVRLSARGGLAVVDNAWIPAPSIGGGVVVVSVGQEPGVKVYHDRQLVGVTDAHGKVIVPGLRSFEQNAISFDAEDLPLSVDFDATELMVTPGFRTGHTIAFKVKRPFNVIARIVGDDEAPLPTGMMLADADTGETYPVGSDGNVYVPDAGNVVRLQSRAQGKTCEAVIRAPAARGEMPMWNAGQVVCHATTMASLR